MNKKPVSKKAPIILAIAWLVISVGSFIPVWMKIRTSILSGAPIPNIASIYAIALSVVSVATMAVIRTLSRKAQITWLATLSKILLIFYSVSGGLYMLVFGILALVGWL